MINFLSSLLVKNCHAGTGETYNSIITSDSMCHRILYYPHWRGFIFFKKYNKWVHRLFWNTNSIFVLAHSTYSWFLLLLWFFPLYGTIMISTSSRTLPCLLFIEYTRKRNSNLHHKHICGSKTFFKLHYTNQWTIRVNYR